MGCGGSKAKSFEEVVSKPAFKQSLLQFRTLQLSQSDLKKIYKVFVTMDIDGSGTISLAELLAHLDLPRTAYTEKIFTIFDDDGSGAIDFREFVLSVWNYCTLSKVNLDMFAFDLYDTDGSGELSPPEVIKLLQEIFGKNEMKTDVHAKSALAEIAQFQAKKVKFDPIKFHHFMGNHQALMFPSIQMQQALHKKVCGAGFWEKHRKQREARSHGVYMSLAHFIMSPEEMSLANISSANSVVSGSESHSSLPFNSSLNGSLAALSPRPDKAAAASQMKAMVSGMAALKAARARQAEAKKLQAELFESGNATGQTVLGDGAGSAPMTQSGKVRWVQSMQQGMSGLIGSMKQKRKFGRNKVYASGSASTITTASTGSILSTIGVDAPVHSIPKPGTHAANREKDKEKEREKEAEKEQSVRSHARTQRHAHGHGHGHGHGSGSAGNSVVASPIVSPREGEPHAHHHGHQHGQDKHDKHHGHHHSNASKADENSKHHGHDHKRRGSDGGAEVSKRKSVRQ